MKDKPEMFVCDLCKEEFEKAWSDEEAAAEFKQRLGFATPANHATVCEACYKKLLVWHALKN